MVGLYVIYDRVAQEAGPVFSAKNDGIALRSSRSALKGVERIDDYQILSVARFDTETCQIIPEPQAREVLEMTDVEEVLK